MATNPVVLYMDRPAYFTAFELGDQRRLKWIDQ